MTINEITKLIPATEAERLDATTPGYASNFWRQRIFEARDELEKLLQQTGRVVFADIRDLFFSDQALFEQVLTGAEGQELIRANIATARRLLENLE